MKYEIYKDKEDIWVNGTKQAKGTIISFSDSEIQ